MVGGRGDTKGSLSSLWNQEGVVPGHVQTECLPPSPSISTFLITAHPPHSLVVRSGP